MLKKDRLLLARCFNYTWYKFKIPAGHVIMLILFLSHYSLTSVNHFYIRKLSAQWYLLVLAFVSKRGKYLYTITLVDAGERFHLARK